MAYAHSANRDGIRHDLLDHLRAVSDLAANFAAPLGAAEAMRQIGLWHDLGKFHPGFQQYLLNSEAGVSARRRGPDHKAAGAHFACRHVGILAMLIQAHHGGLRSPSEFKTWLTEHSEGPVLAAALDRARQALPGLDAIGPVLLPPQAERDPLAAELLMRLLFSALVDADYLDTEAHFDPTRAGNRGRDTTIASLWRVFERAQAGFTGRRQDRVGQIRHEVYEHCLRAAALPPGIFRLTVPTGGGKTRSGLGFALRHALLHGQQHVIVAIPFISITEQTADVYRQVLEPGPHSPHVVLEQHSAVIAAGDDDPEGHTTPTAWARLAAENWDAPVIVTTTVQLFESLFSNHPSKVRKLHRLANSVIILDEAQSLPPHLLTPILDVLTRMVATYNTTVVLSTATQPAFQAIPAFRGLQATEIVPQAERVFAALKRVDYIWRIDPPLDWPAVAALMRAEPQCLAVLNTKRDALALLETLADPSTLHLSTLLCGAHRRKVITEVKRRLASGQSCRLVSTQVVEAGVDLDFPVVLRAIGPLDSIIQAAGRCNREGHLPTGRVIVFAPADGHLPRGTYKAATGVSRALLGTGNLDLHGTAAPAAYFTQLFATIPTDREGIQELRRKLDYPEVARLFRMIDDDAENVVVHYGSQEEQECISKMLDDLRAHSPAARLILRRLQPYIVSLHRRRAQEYARRGLVAPVMPGLGEWLGRYDPLCGIAGDDPDPDTLVV